MSMTINGQLVNGSDNLTTIMNRHQTVMGKAIEKISSGKRINHAGDDSSGNAISEKMMTQIRALDQSNDNTQDANSLLSVASGAISSMIDVIQAMKAKALEASSSALGEDERTALGNELNYLRDQVEGAAQVTFKGMNLLTGNYGTIEEAAIYDDDGNEVERDELSFKDFSWKEGSDNALYFQVGPEKNFGITTHLMDMTKLFDGVEIDVSTIDGAAKTAKALDKSLTRALYQQTEIGSLQERLEFTSDNLQMMSNETTGALSTLQDADMAKEMTEFVKTNVLMQATQAMMAQANSNLASVVDLVRAQ